MAAPIFKAGKDGNGRVRFFVDGATHTIDEYIAKHVKYHGTLPEIPIGLGGRAEPTPPPAPDPVKAEIDALKARVAELEAEKAKVEEAGKELEIVEEQGAINQG